MDLSPLAGVFEVILQRQKLMRKNAPSLWYHHDPNAGDSEGKHPLSFTPTVMGSDRQQTNAQSSLQSHVPSGPL